VKRNLALETKLEAWLTEHGAEVLPTTNDWEVVRFKAIGGTCVIYKNGKGTFSFSNDSAREAMEAFANHRMWSAVAIHKRRAKQSVESKLMGRDGDECFYCGSGFTEESPATLEHLLSIAHGGGNHMANMVLVHGRCNEKAGSLHLFGKVKLRDRLRQEAEWVRGEKSDAEKASEACKERGTWEKQK